MLKRVLVETDIKISEQHLFEIVHYIYNVNDIHYKFVHYKCLLSLLIYLEFKKKGERHF